MAVIVAFATGSEGSYIAPGHFAHAPRFIVYKIEDGEASLVEDRENPLGSVPDLDAEGHEHGHHHHSYHAMGLHGPPKYYFLRERVLPDADILVAGGACPTSVTVFVNEGVKIVFTEPGTEIGEILEALKNASELPELSEYADGEIRGF